MNRQTMSLLDTEAIEALLAARYEDVFSILEFHNNFHIDISLFCFITYILGRLYVVLLRLLVVMCNDHDHLQKMA